jgi:hypothetical protein
VHASLTVDENVQVPGLYIDGRSSAYDVTMTPSGIVCHLDDHILADVKIYILSTSARKNHV